MMDHIGGALPKNLNPDMNLYSPSFFRSRIPELQDLSVTDEMILRSQAVLLEYMRGRNVCANCQGFEKCGKEGDARGFTQVLERYGSAMDIHFLRCKPYEDHVMKRRVLRYANFSGSVPQDEQFQFENFPTQQKAKYPKLLEFTAAFANTFVPGKEEERGGVYLFGPPGVGKTHLLLAVLNRLKSRGVPCLFVRSDSIFDRMRHIIADNGDLEPFLDTYATVPVLGIDEFAQERANDFTLEKLFRIVNYRFHAKLPTWFTSNFAPPDMYRRGSTDINDSVAPLRSRILQMCFLAKLDGEDARQANLRSLT